MFLDGGIMAGDKDILVARPGDVIAAHIVKRLLKPWAGKYGYVVNKEKVLLFILRFCKISLA